MEPYSWRIIPAQDKSYVSPPSIAAALARFFYNRGEKRLMLAVLVDAIDSIEHCQLGRGGKSWRDGRDAAQWILAHDPRWPFSFENICLALDLDAEKLRETLRQEFPAVFLTANRADTSPRKVWGDLPPVRG